MPVWSRGGSAFPPCFQRWDQTLPYSRAALKLNLNELIKSMFNRNQNKPHVPGKLNSDI